ncbi:tryptophan synthase subunit alpha [Clostridium sp. D53t1_180928_C8]|uniref:tryptophan synthase subunit alpha n=1 Tax=Clostridium sp. D53t1_180928_C8 TaxID=2787101 RepID=UPI0018A8B1FC|nr:tryptophan synthase subunit alpha [Clostridium sp. D53t1_180928_C8]
MSNIYKAFENKKAFIGFLTAGDPSEEKTVEYILEMERAGADLIEIGIPFSDPTAEGVVIQNANIRALNSGMTTNKVFDIVKKVREKSNIPLVFLTYINPVYKYGYDEFFVKCKEVGVDGIIIPDVPFEEKNEIEHISNKYDIDIISLIAPTSEERIKTIAKEAKGFIYVVSSMGVTGVRSEIETDIENIIKSIKKVTDVPCAVGFGINNPNQAREISEISDGVIVGSAIVKIIERYGNNANEELFKYTRKMKNAIKYEI